MQVTDLWSVIVEFSGQTRLLFEIIFVHMCHFQKSSTVANLFMNSRQMHCGEKNTGLALSYPGHIHSIDVQLIHLC